MPDFLGEPGQTRLAGRLTSSLFEHELTLRATEKQWEKAWGAFQKERRELESRASLLLQRHESLGMNLEKAGKSLALAVLHAKATGSALDEPSVQPTTDGQMRLLPGPTEQNAVLIEGQISGLEAQEALVVVTQDVESQLAHPAVVTPAVEAYSLLGEASAAVEHLVDTVWLKGRPDGLCSLCPVLGVTALT